MKKHNPPVENGAVKLHANYLGILRRRAEELRHFSRRCQEGQLTTSEIDDMHMRVHSLAGSGATYGYARVSETAGPLDRALENPSMVGIETLSTLAGNLIDICTGTMREEEHADPKIKLKPVRPEPVGPNPVILVIDDDPAIHDLVEEMFKASAKIVKAYNSNEALDAMHRYCPDLVLLDNYMPGIDGLKFLEDLNDDISLPIVPIIMLTANNKPQEIMRATSSGVADYITKPFEPQELNEKISGLLRRSQMTVLIANSNETLRDLIATRLRRMGFNVMEAADAKQTMEHARVHMPDLILIDQLDEGILHEWRADKRTRHIPMLYIASDRHGRPMLEGANMNTPVGQIKSSMPEKVTARVLEALGLDAQW